MDSTNERARRLALAGAAHGTLVTADEQTAGRGRQGRGWTAPRGSAVLASLVLREVHELLPLAAAVAVCEACEALAPVRCEIKWPNDVWIERRKLAGILVEGRPQEGWAILGVGLNVEMQERELPSELRGTATSLRIASPEEPCRVEEVLGALLEALPGPLAAPPAQLLVAFQHRDALAGERVRWQGGEGTAAGVDASGALVVETPTGPVTLGAGEVHLLR